MDVIVTAAAEKFIRRMLRMGGSADSGFRLVVTPGGCSGLTGAFSVESAPTPGDLVLDHGGMKFFLPAQSRALLDGVTIDFADTATQTGFVFHDPTAAAKNCGTGAPAPAGIANVSIASIARRPASAARSTE